MKVLWKNVLIEPIVEDVTKGGIILTKVVKKPIGIVKFIGHQVETVKIGDKVMYNKYENKYIDFEEKEYLVIHEESVDCIIN